MIIVCDTLRKIFVQIGDPRNILGLRFRCDAIYSELKLFLLNNMKLTTNTFTKKLTFWGPPQAFFCGI